MKKNHLIIASALLLASASFQPLQASGFDPSFFTGVGGVNLDDDENTDEFMGWDTDGDGEPDVFLDSTATADSSGIYHSYYTDTDGDGIPDTFVSSGVSTSYTFPNPNSVSNSGQNNLSASAITETARQNISSKAKDIIRGSDGFLPQVSAKNYQKYKTETGDSFEAMMRAMAEAGPIEAAREEKRLWVAPFYSSGSDNATKGSPSQRRYITGSLVGAEYRDLKHFYTIGLVGGLNVGRQEEKLDKESNVRSNGHVVGIYHTKGLAEGAAYEFIATRLNMKNDFQRHDFNGSTPFKAKSSNKTYIHTVDFQGNYKFRLPRKGDSIRVNLGITYNHFNNKGHTETGAPALLNQTHATSTGASRELYGGLGYRRSWRIDETLRIRATALYEYGVEFSKTGAPTTIQYANGTKSITTPDGPKDKTHYFTFNTSLLDETIRWKVVLGYVGSYKKDSRNHTVTMKIEYRW